MKVLLALMFLISFNSFAQDYEEAPELEEPYETQSEEEYPEPVEEPIYEE